MTERLLAYRVSVVGQADFARDLNTVMGLVRKNANEEVALSRMVADRRTRARTDEGRHQAALLRTQLSLEKARARESVRDAERAEKEKTKAADRAEKERGRNAREQQRASMRLRAQEIREFERIEREKTRLALRETRARENEQKAATRRAVRDEERRMRDAAFDRKRLYRGVATGAIEGGLGAVGVMGRTLSRGVRGIMSGSGLGNTFDIADIVAERAHVQNLLRRASIEARTAGSAFGGFDEVTAAGKIRGASLKYGISQRDLAQAVDTYSEKGSGATAIANIDRIASQATAMGTSAAVVAKLRAQMGISSKASGKELTEEEKDQLIARMHFVGKTGVFRAEDMAEESEAMFANFAKNGGSFTKGFNRYLNFANEARSASGTGAEARTSINSVQDQIAKKEGRINALGVATRDKEGNRRDFIDVAMDVIQKTGAKGDAYFKIFDPSRSGKALANLEATFHAAKGGKAGREAMEKLLQGDESLKYATPAEMMKDTQAALDTPAMRMQQAAEKIRQSLMDALLPALEKLSANAPMIATRIAQALDLITKHPILAGAAGVGALAAGGAAKAIVRHGVGSAARFAAESLVNTVPRLAPGAAGIAGALGGMISQAGSTPVYVTGAAPGVMGGGGMPGVPGGIGGIGGAVGGAGIMGTIGGVAALTVATTAVTVGMWELYKTTDTYKKKLDETVEKHLKDKSDLGEALDNKVTPEKMQKTIEGITFQAGSKTHGDTVGGEGVLVQSRAADKFIGANKQTALKMIDDAFAGNSTKSHGALATTDAAGKLDAALGIKATGGAKLVGPAAEGVQAIKAASEAERFANAMKSASETVETLNRKLSTLDGNASRLKGPITRG